MDNLHGESAAAGDSASAGLAFGRTVAEGAKASGHYVVECHDAEGNLKWTDKIENLVTTPGRNDALDKYLSGSGYTAAWYLLLISNTSYTTGPNAADTAASHSGWTESTVYSNATRPAATFGAAAAGSKATSSASVFNINGSDTIKGCGLIANNVKGGTSGVLYSVGLFSGGDKPVSNGDILNVSYTASLT